MFKHIMGISVHFAVTAAGFQSYEIVTRLSPSKIDAFSKLPNIAGVCRRLPTVMNFFGFAKLIYNAHISFSKFSDPVAVRM